MRKKIAETNLEFSSWFSAVVLTGLFTGFVFTGSRLVWDSLPSNFRLSLQSRGWRSTVTFTLRARLLTNVQLRVFPLIPPGMWTYPFPVVPHLRRRFGTHCFSSNSNYRNHTPVTSWPTAKALAWLLLDPHSLLYLVIFFCLLPRNLLYNLKIRNQVTLDQLPHQS